tara:strand:+ start:162 stop:422 length:261 start_codon:yes stop_codon:yes gene_type:complete
MSSHVNGLRTKSASSIKPPIASSTVSSICAIVILVILVIIVIINIINIIVIMITVQKHTLATAPGVADRIPASPPGLMHLRFQNVP